MKKMFICNFYILPWNEINEVRADFGATFPGVIGAIDGTLIHIRCPSENREAYNYRKRFYALNVQVQQNLVMGGNAIVLP